MCSENSSGPVTMPELFKLYQEFLRQQEPQWTEEQCAYGWKAWEECAKYYERRLAIYRMTQRDAVWNDYDKFVEP